MGRVVANAYAIIGSEQPVTLKQLRDWARRVPAARGRRQPLGFLSVPLSNDDVGDVPTGFDLFPFGPIRPQNHVAKSVREFRTTHRLYRFEAGVGLLGSAPSIVVSFWGPVVLLGPRTNVLVARFQWLQLEALVIE